MRFSRALAGALYAVVVGLGGCSDAGSPTETKPTLDPAVPAVFGPAVDDAAQRLMPALSDSTLKRSLAAHLAGLDERMAALDRDGARQHVDGALRLLADYASRGLKPDSPDVTAVRLMLVHTALSIGMPVEASLIP